jgi:hypothetical protein
MMQIVRGHVLASRFGGPATTVVPGRVLTLTSHFFFADDDRCERDHLFGYTSAQIATQLEWITVEWIPREQVRSMIFRLVEAFGGADGLYKELLGERQSQIMTLQEEIADALLAVDERKR